MPEDTYTQFTADGGKLLLMSRKGVALPQSEFEGALQAYQTGGKGTAQVAVVPQAVAQSALQMTQAGPVKGENIPEQMLPGLAELRASLGQQAQTGALTVGTAAAQPMMAPVTGVMPFIGNMLKSAGVGGLAYGGTDALMNRRVDPGQIATGAAIGAAGAALQGGFEGAYRYVLGKQLANEQVEKVAGGVLESIQKRVPTLQNDPNALNIGVSAKAGLEEAIHQGADALKYSVQDATSSLVKDVQGVIGTKSLTPTEWRTLHGYIGKVSSSADTLIRSIGDEKAHDAAKQSLLQAQQQVQDFISSTYQKKMGQFQAEKVLPGLASVMQEFNNGVNGFQDGMAGLRALQAASETGKFDPLTFARMYQQGQFGRPPSDMLQEIAKIVGGGQSPIGMDLGTAQQGQQQGPALLNKALSLLTGGKYEMLRTAQQALRTPPATGLPWQQPPVTDPVLRWGAQRAGQEAMRSFMGREGRP